MTCAHAHVVLECGGICRGLFRVSVIISQQVLHTQRQRAHSLTGKCEDEKQHFLLLSGFFTTQDQRFTEQRCI